MSHEGNDFLKEKSKDESNMNQMGWLGYYLAIKSRTGVDYGSQFKLFKQQNKEIT